MCKNLVPLETSDTAIKKSCKPAMLGRIWQATRRALNLEHSHPHVFACCQWQEGPRPTKLYVFFRWVLFVTVLSICGTSFLCQHLPPQYDGPTAELNRFKWFIYFTNWGYLFIVLQAILALAVVHYYRNKKNFNLPCDYDEIPMPRKQRTPALCRAYWLVFTIATDLAFVITFIYWTLVHDPQIHEVDALNILVHGCNSMIMLIELGVTAHPMRAAHAVYGAGAGLAYGVFSAMYWAIGGTDRLGLPAIYPELDWNKPASALGFVALCAVVMMIAHGIATCLAYARTRLAAKSSDRSNVDGLPLPTN